LSIELITILMFGLMLLLLASGLPIVFVLGGTAALFGVLAWGPASIHVIVANASDLMRATILVAVPLFVFMAYMLERAGIAEDLYDVMYRWMGPLRGGIAAGTVLSCTVVAAMSGISTSGVLLMGIIGLPAMLRRKYDKKLAMGSIMAGGALGPLIPPSVVLIIYSLIAGESVGKLFLGGVLPGLLLSCLFVGYILIRCYFNPRMGPALPREERANFREKFLGLKGVIFPVLLVIGVLGSIFAGLATPTEASAVGAFGSAIAAAFHRRFTWTSLRETSLLTLRTTAMVMWVIFGAGCFATIYQGLGASDLIQNFLKSWPVNKFVILILMQITWVILGALMDSISILMITSPIFIPVAVYLEFDLLWFGILYAVNTEMGYLTPPFGVNLIVMKGIVQDKGIGMGEVYNAVWPFVCLQAIGLIFLLLMPGLATWLPNIFLK
jgi:tripartite ATP-independent transporter DctM subunit